MVLSWRSQKPSSIAGEKDGEMPPTAGAVLVVRICPSQCAVSWLLVPEPPPVPRGLRERLQIALPRPSSPDPLRSAFLALRWMLSGSCRH